MRNPRSVGPVWRGRKACGRQDGRGQECRSAPPPARKGSQRCPRPRHLIKSCAAGRSERVKGLPDRAGDRGRGERPSGLGGRRPSSKARVRGPARGRGPGAGRPSPRAAQARAPAPSAPARSSVRTARMPALCIGGRRRPLRAEPDRAGGGHLARAGGGHLARAGGGHCPAAPHARSSIHPPSSPSAAPRAAWEGAGAAGAHPAAGPRGAAAQGPSAARHPAPVTPPPPPTPSPPRPPVPEAAGEPQAEPALNTFNIRNSGRRPWQSSSRPTRS